MPRSGGAVGVLWVANRPGRIVYRQNATVDGTVLRIPAAVVEAEGGHWIQRRLSEGGKVRVRLDVASSTRASAESENVVAVVRGRERPDETVVLGAHLDSWDLGRGALDNGCNVAMVIDVARAAAALAKAGHRPRRTLRFVLFGDGPADCADDLGRVARLDVALDLVDDDEAFLAPDLDREGRAPFGPEGGVGLLDRPLDVLGVDVASPDDDQVLEAAGDDELAVPEEAEVSGAKLAAEKAGVDVSVVAAQGFSTAPEQITQAENALTRGTDAIVLNPVDVNASAPIIDMAKRKGVPTIVVGTLVDTEDAAQVVQDDYMQGQAAADALAARLPDGGKGIVMAGPANATWSVGRTQGFLDRVGEKYPAITVTAVANSNVDPGEGLSKFTNAASSNPTVDWKHAWETYGTCTNMTQVQYFNTTLSLYAKYGDQRRLMELCFALNLSIIPCY